MMQKELEKKDDDIERLKDENKNKTKARITIKNDLETFLATKIEELQSKTRAIVKEEIKRSTEIMKETSNKTYAEITKKHQEEIKQANEQRIMDEKENREIESRKHNVIIHGLKEDEKDSEERTQQRDQEDIKDLFRDIGVPMPRLTHHRIGKSTKQKTRPIKVIFENKHNKDCMMKNLYELKDHPHYENVSIAEDFTIEERKKIKEFHEEAKKRNADENNKNFIWLVRGSPRTSLRLEKILKTSSNCTLVS